MNKTRTRLIVASCMCLMLALVAKIFAESGSDESNISIRKVEEETVLYTIYRGSYDKIGPVIGNLYALAGKNSISPRGSAYYVYLNNPNQVSSQHWITEIRIPVSKDALKAAGTLGEMTDIKILPTMEMTVAVKPEGQAEPRSVYKRLYSWIFKQGYMPAGSPREVFLTNAMSGDYSKMKTEIMIPIQKISPAKG